MNQPLSNGLARLADETGTFAMVAVDQRESLRTMMQSPDVAPIPDEALVEFKLLATEILAHHATAVLLDRHYGLPAARVARCALILAADDLIQEPGGPVTASELDPGVTPDLVHELGASALKMLVPWLPDAAERAIESAGQFMDLCRAAEVPGVVEGVVRPADIASWSDEQRNDAIVRAAMDLATVEPDLYKAEVPSYGRGESWMITEVSLRITKALQCPWVVLSSGVTAADFPTAVAACTAGGARGFLAGRAVWADAVNAADTKAFLRGESSQRLERLHQIARREATP